MSELGSQAASQQMLTIGRALIDQRDIIKRRREIVGRALAGRRHRFDWVMLIGGIGIPGSFCRNRDPRRRRSRLAPDDKSAGGEKSDIDQRHDRSHANLLGRSIVMTRERVKGWASFCGTLRV